MRLLIADDHKVVRAGLSALLSLESDFTVVAEASDGAEAVEMWRLHQPDVTLMDLNMPNLGGVQAIGQIRNLQPLAVIIVLSTFDGDEDIYNALRAGAKGYLLKDTEPAELFLAIRRAGGGNTYIPPQIAEKLVGRISLEALTERELQIMRLVVKGHSNKVIARELTISEGTVKTHLKSILDKLDATSRTEASSIALKRGIVRI